MNLKLNMLLNCWKLRVVKGQATPSVASQPSQKNVSSLEWDHAPLTNSQQTTASTNAFERSETDLVEEVPITEDEGYCVYLLRLIYSSFYLIFMMYSFFNNILYD